MTGLIAGGLVGDGAVSVVAAAVQACWWKTEATKLNRSAFARDLRAFALDD